MIKCVKVFNFGIFSEDDDQIVTPFAQILAKLKDVRKNLGTVGKKYGFRDQLSFLHHDKKGSK